MQTNISSLDRVGSCSQLDVIITNLTYEHELFEGEFFIVGPPLLP